MERIVDADAPDFERLLAFIEDRSGQGTL